jgi:arylsulfatase
MRMMSSTGPSVGSDHGSPVSRRYDDSFPFEGELARVDIQLLSRPGADVAAAEARATMARQ